jgi:hypothetical protein
VKLQYYYTSCASLQVKAVEVKKLVYMYLVHHAVSFLGSLLPT